MEHDAFQPGDILRDDWGNIGLVVSHVYVNNDANDDYDNQYLIDVYVNGNTDTYPVSVVTRLNHNGAITILQNDGRN